MGLGTEKTKMHELVQVIEHELSWKMNRLLEV